MIGMSFSFMRFTSNSFGIITNVLINWVGCRLVLFIGGAFHCLGLLASTLAPDAKWFCVSLTLFGIGNNMVYNSSTLIIPQYFDKVHYSSFWYFNFRQNVQQICFQKRSTAIGLTQALGALGVMVLPQFIVLGVEYFDGWHSVVRIIAGGCIITWYAG